MSNGSASYQIVPFKTVVEVNRPVDSGPSPRSKKWSGEKQDRVPKARDGSPEKILIYWCF